MRLTMNKIVTTIAILNTLAALAGANLIPLQAEEVSFKYAVDFKYQNHSLSEEPLVDPFQFGIRGDLHIRKDPVHSGAILSLRNIEFSNESSTAIWSEIGQEVQVFVTPFAIQNSASGLSNDFLLQTTDESSWVMNIKRALASNLQVNWAEINNQPQNEPFTFQSQESTLYGSCDVKYEVTPQETTFKILRSYNPAECENSNNQVQPLGNTGASKQQFVVSKKGEILEMKSEDVFRSGDGDQVLAVTQNITRIGVVAESEQRISDDNDFNRYSHRYSMTSLGGEDKGEHEILASAVRSKRDANDDAKKSLSNCASHAGGATAVLAGITAAFPNPFTLIGTGISAAMGAVCGLGTAM